jgi:flagellar hook-associated protein 2
VAQAQTAVSAAVADPNNTIIGSGTLTIATGRYDAIKNVFVANARPAVSVSVVNGSLNSIATAINASGAGVTATVIQDVSGYRLALTSIATGAGNGFRVSVQDTDGSNLDTAGLSQLAYDPSKPVGAGQNLTLAQAAQDAVYTVNQHIASSASDTVTNALAGITLTLSQPSPKIFYRVQPATVSVGQSAASLTANAKSLINTFNTLVGTLSGLVGKGGALPGDALIKGLLNGLQNSAMQDTTGIGTYTSLGRLGFSLNQDGTLSLNSTALRNAYNANPTQAVAVLNRTVEALADFANPQVASQYFTDNAGNQESVGGTLTNAQQNIERDAQLLQPWNATVTETQQSFVDALQFQGTSTATSLRSGVDKANAQYARALSDSIVQRNAAALIAASFIPHMGASPTRPRHSLIT